MLPSVIIAFHSWLSLQKSNSHCSLELKGPTAIRWNFMKWEWKQPPPSPFPPHPTPQPLTPRAQLKEGGDAVWGHFNTVLFLGSVSNKNILLPKYVFQFAEHSRAQEMRGPLKRDRLFWTYSSKNLPLTFTDGQTVCINWNGMSVKVVFNIAPWYWNVPADIEIGNILC